VARYTKQEAVSILYAAATSYQEKLSKRMFRLIYKSNLHQHMEAVDVAFQPENFKHLTGIQTDIRPWRFYDACLKRRLSVRDIALDNRGNAQRKLQVIKAMPDVFYHQCWIGASIGNDIYINADYYVGDTRCVLSIGFRNELRGDVPITLKKQSIREVVKKECKVYAIAAKSLPKTQGSWELTYCEQGFSPEEWLSE